ncbi:MAG: discoidin domain-containing protein [Anaerolineales bacterium]|nr:discoidin domain-containing protein [Anaerolineales bacterium]
MSKHFLLVWLSLVIAALACARAEVPLTPATPAITTPVQGSATVRPTETAPPAGYPANPSPAAPTQTSAPAGYPTNEASPTVAASDTPAPPTPTGVIQPPPTETPTITSTPEPTATIALATTQAPTTNTPTTAPSTPTSPPTSGTGPQSIPANAQFVQTFEISHQGGQLVGIANDMKDGRPETWASLRGGNAAWVLNLGSTRTVLGLRVNAQPDLREPTTLTRIEVSTDGSTWRTVYTGSGECGVPQCDTLPQKVFLDLGFGAQQAQYIRLTGGPTRFAFGEIQVALAP